jgi:transcriptional regulator with XRE-family HTH domain
MVYKDIDDYLWKTRTKQEEFAKRLGFTNSYVSLLKNKKREPSLRLAIKISKLGIPIESLVSSKGKKPRTQATTK